MNLELTAKDVELDGEVRDYIDRKLGRLDRILSDIRATRVELRHGLTRSQGEVYTTQITAWVNRAVLRAEEMHPDLFASIDLASDKINRQVERYKGKRLDRWHSSGTREPNFDEPLEEDQSLTRIVRRKRFEVYSMSEEEALEQIELLGHDFFLYRDADTGDMRLLYRRKDGRLGMIEPLMA